MRADTILIGENNQSGTTDWYSANFAAQTDLAVWGSPYAPRAGESVDLYIHANAAPVTIVVYRIGWYGGKGARKVLQLDSVVAGKQAPCTTSEPVVCPWSRTVTFKIGADWVSGVYWVKVVDRTTHVAYYPFVVSDPRPATFTAVVPQFTWQAYNDFGNRSLYSVIDGVRNHKVSFERPYRASGGGSLILSNVGSHELSAIRWLERMNYDVRYVSDVDVMNGDFHPTKGLLFIGHDEYWTFDEFTKVQNARDRRVHLAFLAANNAYRNIRLSAGTVTGRSAQLISCYKTDPDLEATTIAEVTTQFRDEPLNRPENALYGIMYTRIASSSEFPLAVADSALGRETREFLRMAGMNPGDTVPGLSVHPVPSAATSFEGDMIVDNGRTPSNLQVLLRMSLPYYPRGEGPNTIFHTTFFVAPGGAGVFASGINEWGRWLDSYAGPENRTIQGLTAAVLDWMKIH